MSTAISFLHSRGLTARANGLRIVVSPASKITKEDRLFVSAHRLEILAELAANDGIARHSHWKISVPGYRPFTMCSEPLSYDEALTRAKARWPDATILEE
ncbi:hypothetical protein [Stutzerimonas kunmingensis]|uniref:hypothetical protein n=1 Tax=Stutzerimonas kunmingensis TaxID=1211807 RepID=UPI0028B1D395|nr:hypothetical protein [Stutzerimonas kunmingensis]